MRSGRTGAPRRPGAGTPIWLGTCLSPVRESKGQGVRGEASATRRTRHPAPRHGSWGEAAPWAGAPRRAGLGAPQRRAPGLGGDHGKRLNRGACSTGPQRWRRRHLVSLQACTHHRPQLGPTPRPPAASAGVAAPSRTPSSLGSGEPTPSRDSAPAILALKRLPWRRQAAAAAAAAAAAGRLLAPGDRGRGRGAAP